VEVQILEVPTTPLPEVDLPEAIGWITGRTQIRNKFMGRKVKTKKLYNRPLLLDIEISRYRLLNTDSQFDKLVLSN
jgi:hypothetical protein